MRQSKQYNKVVDYNKETGEITVLSEIFNYENNFKGATGSVFEAVSRSQFNETIEPYLNDDKELLIYMAENFGDLNREMTENVDSSEDALKGLFFDLSYEEMWEYLRKELELDEDKAYIFNCVGGGRCFDKDFQGNINESLSKLIRDIEK